ncbi:MAG: hypothetical protein WD851_21070 [Pirellulales bacterium]
MALIGSIWSPASGTTQFSTRSTGRLASIRLAAALLAVLCCSIGGCGGCREQSPQQQAQAKKVAEEKEKKKKAEEAKQKKKPDYEIGPAIPQPAESGQPRLAKPGHWITASQLMKANYGDFIGETTLQVFDKERKPLPVPRTPYTLSAERPVALVKGRVKSIDSTLYIPPAEDEVRLQATLRERTSGRRIPDTSQRPLTLMPPYQYYVVVLAKEPTRYTFLKTLNSFKAPVDTEDNSDDTVHYHVLLPDISRRVPLPEGSLCWSSIAYLVWDEVDPEQLNELQRTALVDWLHWGGQLLVSGPDSLDLLNGSFLSAYLPADTKGARTIGAADLQPLNQTWTFAGRAKPIVPTSAWSGIKLLPRSEAQWVPGTGDLLAERRVGRGRILVSAFQFAERDLLTWGPPLDQLVNSALLRREAREFSRGPYDELHVNWAGKPDHRLDAAFNSQLRYFGRDTHDDPTVTNYRTVVATDPAMLGIAPGNIESTTREETLPPLLAGGVAGWNDESVPALAAAAALREAAGVNVPDATFVLIRLGAYLLVLVPLNWAIFHSIGRVEWAWVAAPLIALAGTWVVVRQAQLDIGFVRAQTEIAVLELQPNYPRGHLTRFTALYTSLSTTYELAYDDPSTLAAPFPAGAVLPGQSIVAVAFSQQDKVRLSNLEVTSASTRMVHSEEMTSATAGLIVLGESSRKEPQIENHSALRLHSVAIIRPSSNGKNLDVCWIGELRPGASAILYYDSDEATLGRMRKQELKGLPRRLLNLEPLFEVACDPRHLDPGEVRLVARVDEILPGSAVTPAASQAQGATLVIAHLQYGQLPPPTPDVNSPLDVLTQK